MDDDYWNTSSVRKKVSQQGIFDTDSGSAIDRFKKQSDPLIESILDSSRVTPPVNPTGAVSTRFRATAAAPSNPPATIPITVPTKATPISQPKMVVPPTPVPRPSPPPTESARFGRSQAPPSSSDNHSTSQWLPNAEEYPDQSGKDRSTQYDGEMELRCRELLENRAVKLDDIREYDKKASLLRKAVSFNTPSVIVPVMIFLENSLSRSLFYELIKQHPSAVKNYINTAKLRFDSDYYVAMLKQFGRNEDVAMIRLRQVSQTNDIHTKMAILDQAATELGTHPWWHLQVAEQRLLLSKQRELQSSSNNRTVLDAYKTIYEADFRKQKQNRAADKSATVDRSKEFETTFHMSPEMVMCGRLAVIMQSDLRAYYDDFVHQAIHQGIFGKKYIIAPEYLADMVYNWALASGEGQEKASERADRFLTMIADPNKRIYFAEKFQNFNVAIDTIVNNLRDRGQLDILRRRMPHDHPSYHRATSLLENTKWRS